MSKESTERKAKSQDRKVIKDLSMQEVYDFLQQQDITYEKSRATVLLEQQYEDAISDSKTAHLSRENLLNRGFGKAKQAIDMTSNGETVTAGIFIDTESL